MSTSYYSAASLSASLDYNGDPSKVRRPRMPSPQPSFARAISIPSSRNSPAASPFHYEFNGSLQSTPEGMVPVSHSSLPIPPIMHLPDSLMSPPPMSTPPTSSPSAMSEALSKGPGLIRRVSRGAQNIPNKFRRNGSTAHRDKSSGPVIMRRRSDSRSAADAAMDVSDFDLNFEEEEAVEDFGEPINALGISSNVPSVSSIPDSTVTAPKRNSILEQGTILKKVTKKETKTVTLRLDLDHAKVYWDLSRPSKAFYIDDVKEIRSGLEAKHYREECKYSEGVEPLWFTIVYSDTTRAKGKIKQMHLIATNHEIVKLWTHTLDSVSRNRINMMAGLLGFGEKSAKLVWQREMKKRFKDSDHLEGEESMDLPGIIALCRSLHINCSENTFRYYFDKSDSNQSGNINQTQFLHFVRRLKERRDVKKLYKRLLSEHRAEIDKDTFFSFLKFEQGVNVDADVDHWTAVFEKSARASKPRATPTESGDIPLPVTMNFPAFQTFMASSANSCFVPSNPLLQHNRPLNEYFISSSHNTYLLGRQVVGESSTEAYITALQKGCRCIEVDCWNGRDGPIVSHGRTFTTSITFLDTIKVINQYAFCESEYPLIISLEVHCSPDQQAEMARIMRVEFGEKLLLEPLDWESPVLPSPEQLKNRILIKVKAATEELEACALSNDPPSRRRDRSFSSPFFRAQQLNDQGIPNSPLASPPSMSPPERGAFWGTPRTSTTSTNATIPTSAFVSSADDSDSQHNTEPEDKKKKKSSTSKIIKVLGELGVYTKGVKYSSFRSTEASTCNHVYSFGEHTFNKLIKPGSREKPHLEEHNKRALMRVYPGYDRVTSSNFEPLGVWRRGVQMAALNWQTYDLGQQLNEAMFSGGDDRTGYVLKPAELRPDQPTPIIGNRKPPKKLVKFAVEIISAQQLPRPRGIGQEANINPYVEFEMHCAEDMGPNATGEGGQDASARSGFSGLGEPVRKRTSMVVGNGYNPEFNDRITMTLATRYPSLVFVRWSVWNSRDAQNPERAPLATFTAKLSSLQQGYRHLPLFDSNGEQYLFSTLFCKIEKEDAIDALPETIPECTGSRKSSLDSTSPLQDAANQRSGRSYLKRLVSRKNSGSKRSKDKEERSTTGSDLKLDQISRSSTLER